MNGRGLQPEFGWIADCDQDIAEEALDILMDVVREMQLAANPIRIPPMGTTVGGPRTPIGQEEQLRQHRERVANLLVRQRILGSARYFQNPGRYASERDREGFEIEAEEGPVREARTRLDARFAGRPCGAPVPPPQVPPPQVAEPPDLAWIETSDRRVAQEASDVLREVLAQHDLQRVPQVISPYPRGTDDLKLDFDYHDRMAEGRWQVVEMLRKRRILRGATFVRQRIDYGSGEPVEILIESDEKAVRSAQKLLADHLHPPAPPAAAAAAAAQGAAAPAPTAPRSLEAAKDRSDLRRLFIEEGAKSAGSTGGKWVMSVVIALVVLVAIVIFRLLFAAPHR